MLAILLPGSIHIVFWFPEFMHAICSINSCLSQNISNLFVKLKIFYASADKNLTSFMSS